MKTVTLPIAYMPLVDAAPLVVAQEMGFAQAEGLELDMIAAPSWSSLRDMLAFGRVDAAHMLSAVPIAMALQMGGVTRPLSAAAVLSVNGNVIGVSATLEERLRAQGHDFAFNNAKDAGRALAQAAHGRLTVGVPFPFSMHAELLHYWIAATELSSCDIDVQTVPPPLMTRAIAEGEIDAFCVGEPWGSMVVEHGVGGLLLPGKAIWSFAPEKVLAVRAEWAETEPLLLDRLVRALWRACRWLSQPDSRLTAAAMLARGDVLDVPEEVIDRALSGRLTISRNGDQRHCPGFVEFHRGAANFPWRSQAKWIGEQLAVRTGLDRFAAREAAAQSFRSDQYRRALAGTGADLPGASEKVEGSLSAPTPVASGGGGIVLEGDGFFDGRVFDPYGE
ncbi:MAG: ABC transporter substrate-binding protein [Pseudomonadota bacterium]